MEKKNSFFSKFIKVFWYTLFFVVFTITCAMVIFYASGYKINLKSMKVQKSGMILIDYRDDGIDILIDGKKADYVKEKQGFWSESNYIISILPGKYTIDIKKQGKKDYVDTLVVDEEKITKIENLILIPENIQETKLLENESVSQYCVSENGKKIIYKKDGGVFFYNIENEIKKQVAEDSSKYIFEKCIWDSKDERALLYFADSASKRFYVFNSENPNGSFFLHDLLSFVPELNNIYFSYTDSNIVVGISKNEIYRINIEGKSIDIIESNVNQTFYHKGYLFYIKNDEKNLYQLDSSFYSKDIILEGLELKDDFGIAFIKNRDIYIKNENKIFKINNKNNLELLEDGVDNIVTSNRGDGIFYLKGFELWFYSLDKKESVMVSRFSQAINKAETLNYSYIVHASDSSLGMILENGQNNQEIFNTSNTITDFRVLEKGKILIIQKKEKSFEFSIIDLEVSNN